jgi:ribosomal protein S14
MLLHCIYNEHLLYSDPCAIDSLHEESFHFAHYTGMKRAVHSMYRSKIRNRCFHSGQARGVYCRYRLARFALKMLARNGDLNGISKSS